MRKINIAIDINKDSFIISIDVDGVIIESFEDNEKDERFIYEIKKLLKEYGYQICNN